MKSIAEELSDIISKELSKSDKNNMAKEVVALITELKKAGLIEQPYYNLPLKDTIGKRYYGRINRHIS